MPVTEYHWSGRRNVIKCDDSAVVNLVFLCIVIFLQHNIIIAFISTSVSPALFQPKGRKPAT